MGQLNAYCQEVCAQIRWKRAHSKVHKEIFRHLCDQRDDYIAQGHDAAQATQRALAQMGDATMVGSQLDQVHRPKPQWALIGLVCLLMALGMAINWYTASTVLDSASFQPWHYLLGMAVFAGCYFLDFSILGKHPFVWYGVAILGSLGLVVFAPVYRNGKIFLNLGGMVFSGDYLALVFPLVFSLVVFATKNRGLRGILDCAVAYALPAAILLYIPSLSGLLLHSITCLAVLVVAISKGWFGDKIKTSLAMVLTPAIVVVGLLTWLCTILGYARQRWESVFHPELDPMGSGYQTLTIRTILADTQFLGEGSLSDIDWLLPEASADGLLVLLMHRFGTVSFLVIVGLLCLVLGLTIYKLCQQTSVLGTLVSLPIVILFGLQVALFVAHSLGYGLFTVLSLPLITQTLASILLNAGMLGLLLSVFRTGDA